MSAGPHRERWYLPRKNGPDEQTILGRERFLRALERLRPKVAEDLGKIWPIARELPSLYYFRWEAGQDSSARTASERSLKPAEGWMDEVNSLTPDWESTAGEIEGAIRKWGRRWHLRDEWMLAAALGALQIGSEDLKGFGPTWWLWQLDPPPREHVAPHVLDPIILRHQSVETEWSGLPPGAVLSRHASNPSIDMFPELASWNPLSGEGRSEAAERMMTYFQSQVERHLDESAARVEELGAQPIPRKERRGDRPEDTHYEWLVRWQVPHCETQKEIGERPHHDNPEAHTVTPRSVRDAVKRTSVEIQLTRRTQF